MTDNDTKLSHPGNSAYWHWQQLGLCPLRGTGFLLWRCFLWILLLLSPVIPWL